jgi:hypothetical protein
MAYTVTNNPWTSQYNVGIGTESPGTNLEVFGTDAEMMVHYTGNSRGGFRAMNTQRLAILTTSSSDNLVFGYETDFKSTFTERMRINNSTGRVGIGTNNPIFSLDVSVPTNNQGIRINSVQAAVLYLYSTFNDANNRNWGIYNNSNVFGDFDIRQSNAKDGDMTVGANSTSRLYIKNDGNIGIGTTSPSTILNVASSAPTIRLNPTTQNNSTAIEFGVLNAGNNAYAKIDATNTVNYDTNLRFFTNDVGSTTQVERMRITYTGGVGINTTSPGTYKLNVNGTFYSAGSSLEYKTDITTLDTDTNKILELRPVTYQYKDEYKHLGKELKSGTQIGLIAEEVAEVFPELALLKQDEDGETRVRNVDYEKLSILLLSEVQKLRKEVNELKNK